MYAGCQGDGEDVRGVHASHDGSEACPPNRGGNPAPTRENVRNVAAYVSSKEPQRLARMATTADL